MTTEKLKHHELTAEWVHDEYGTAVMLTQPDPLSDDQPTVLIHPWQLRAVCEKFDLFPASAPQAAKTIATLTRRLHLLRDRAEHLANAMTTNPSQPHQDYARATADIAGEFCAELLEASPCAPDAGMVQPSLI